MSAMTWEYRAIDAQGAKKTGTAQATTEQEVYRQLTAMGLTPLNLRVSSGKSGGQRIKLRQLAQLTGQLSVLVSARLSISEGLYSIAEQEPNKAVKSVVKDVATRVASGETIADSLQLHPRAFNQIYIETVRAAEKSGNLPQALEHLAEMLERQEETRRAIKGALMYPCCVICALTAGVTFLIMFVIPKFAKMFAERGVELPIFTRILQWVGVSAQTYWYVYLIAAVGLIFGIRHTWRNPAGRTLIERLLHKVPYMKSILVGLAMQRFAQVLGVSVKSGIGLIESLELAGRSSGRPLLTADIERLTSQVRSGGRLSEGLPTCQYVTPFAKRMIMAGETSAELPRMCGVVARHYERETTHLTKNIATVIEPILVVLIAGVVMIVALAIFLPMWNMVQLMG
jgi:type II secretory pathway component PulF